MFLRDITLHIKPSVRDEIKARAKEHFPTEVFGILLGTDAGTEVTIEDVYFPHDLRLHAHSEGLLIQEEWWDQAKRHGADDGLSVIGDVHSHCFRRSQLRGRLIPEATPSEYDLGEGHKHISGICLVTQRKGGLRSRVRFWGPMPRVYEQYEQ